MADFGWPGGYGGLLNSGRVIFETGTANTKGAWNQIASAGSVGVGWLYFNVNPNHNVTENYLFDIGIGAAAAEVILFANLPVDVAGIGTGGIYRAPICIPMTLPDSTRIAARAQSSHATTSSVDVTLTLLSAPFTQYEPVSVWDTYGADTAASNGVDLTVANTWTEISASTNNSARWMLVFLAHNGTLSELYTTVISIGIGAAGSEIVLFNYTAKLVNSGSSDGFTPKVISLPCVIPASTRVAAKASVLGLGNMNPSIVVALGR
jgi:hypothetical protein